MRKVSALVVEPNEVIGWGLRGVLAPQPWIERCLLATGAEQALELARRFDPGVALVASQAGELSGVELSRRLVALGGGVRTILLSRHGDLDPDALRPAGAWGCIGWDWPARRIVDAVHLVGASGRMLPRPRAAHSHLSRQQLEVLRLMASGATNPEIAAQLALSTHTVKDHAAALFRRLEVRNRAQAVQRGQSLGLIA